MTTYTNIKVDIHKGKGKKKLQHAGNGGCQVSIRLIQKDLQGCQISIRLSQKDLQGNEILAITNSQAKKLAKAYQDGKGITIRMSSKQLKHNMKIEGGLLGILAGLAARALPMIAKNRCWCSFWISLIRSTKSNAIRYLFINKENVLLRWKLMYMDYTCNHTKVKD